LAKLKAATITWYIHNAAYNI